MHLAVLNLFLLLCVGCFVDMVALRSCLEKIAAFASLSRKVVLVWLLGTAQQIAVRLFENTNYVDAYAISILEVLLMARYLNS